MMREEQSEKRGMRKKDLPPEEEEKTSEVWIDEEKERHEGASAELLNENEKHGAIINPSTAGGKTLNGSKGSAAGGKTWLSK